MNPLKLLTSIMLTKAQTKTVMNTKSLFASKTVILNAIAAIAVIYPPAAAIVSENPELAVGALTVLNFILRLVTSKRVQLF
jgi:hypothetical protein